jgi:hypothetical protein
MDEMLTVMWRWVILAVVMAAVPVGAVDEQTFACEDKSITALAKMSKGRTKCLIACELAKLKGDSMRVCADDASFATPPTLDPVTLACADRRRARYLATVVKVCPPGTYPTCGTYPPSPEDHGQRELHSIEPLIDATFVPLFLCDATQLKCEVGMLSALQKLAADLAKCFRSCAAAVGFDGDPTRHCVTDQTAPSPFAGIDGVTAACVDAAMERVRAKGPRLCPTMPACGLWAGGIDSVLGFVASYDSTGYGVADVGPYCAP